MSFSKDKIYIYIYIYILWHTTHNGADYSTKSLTLDNVYPLPKMFFEVQYVSN